MELNIEEAFRAMVIFLEKYYERTGSDDVGGLLSDMLLVEGGGTMDPSAWYDWLDSVSVIKDK